MNALSIFRFIPMPVIRATALAAAKVINSQQDKGMLWKSRVNIALCYPHLSAEEQENLAKESVVNQCLTYAESVKCWAMSPEWSIKQIKAVHNLHILQDALKDPKGALIITPHAGNWEVMNPWVRQYGSPTIMYKPIKNQTVEKFVLNSRERMATTMVPTSAAGVKALFRCLKQGGFSIILPDHVPDPSGGISAPFFGIPTLTSTLAPKLAQKTHCRMVSIICIRRNDNEGFDIYIDDAGKPEMYDPDILVATTAMNQVIADLINRFPAHYMWGYKRFRGTDETRNLYKQSIENIRTFSF